MFQACELPHGQMLFKCHLGITFNPESSLISDTTCRNNCLNMASPAEQVLSTGSLETLRTEDQRKHVDHAPANLSSSCILGLGTANPTGCYSLQEFGLECLKIYGCHEMPKAKETIERICEHLKLLTNPKVQRPSLLYLCCWFYTWSSTTVCVQG